MADKEIRLKVIAEGETSGLDPLEQKISDMDNSTVKVSADDTEITSLEEEIDNLKGIIEEETAYGFDTSESEAELSELETKLNDLKAKSEEGATFSIDGDTGAIDDMASSLEAINDLMVGEVLQQYGSGAEDMAQQMNEASITVGQLATQTGIAEPQMVSLINHISNATFPNNEAMLYVKSLSQAGVASENLGKSATDIDKINDAFGLGAQTSNSMAMELGVLGVDLNNVSSSFNALAYANANTRGGMENFYTFLRKYDAQFNELGFNVDQSALIISAATQKYGGGRAALTGLSSALKDAGNDSRALEQALGLQAGSLDNASQITSQYEGQLQSLADEEAEHKTLIDQLGAMWEDLSLSISGVVSPIMSFVGLGGQVAGFGMQLNGVWELTQKLRNVGGFSGLKSALISIGSSAKTAGLEMLALAKNTMLAGLNALKSAGMWVLQKAQLIASTLATYAMAGAQALLNLIMSMNPIMLVVLAIGALIAVLVYLYYNVDWVREAFDNLASTLIGAVTGAIQWLISLFTNFTSQLGLNTNDWIQAILGFILFLPTLPLQVGVALANAIAKLLGFKGNFVQSMITTASNAVNGFMNWIRQLPGMIQSEFARIESMVSNFVTSLPQKVWDLGASVVNALKSALGIGSPGHMFYMVEGEFNRIDDLTKKTSFDTSRIGQGMVDSFNPNLQTGNNDILTGNGGNNITINIDNVDSKDRIQQIVQAVEDALKFDNLKAGRTV